LTLGERNTLRNRHYFWKILLALMPLLTAGCANIKNSRTVEKKEIRGQMEASDDELIVAYNEQARAVHSLQATVDMLPTTGSTYSGVIEEYHDVTGFILAQQPSTVRVIGQAPLVSTNVFDMVSDGDTFRIFIPSKNEFLIGPTAVAKPSKKPLENLRPQHIVEALFWPELPDSATVLFEQFNAEPYRYYILTLLRPAAGGKSEIARKIWFDRADLRVSRIQIYGPAGRLDSDIEYTDWQLPDPPAASADPTSTSPAPASEAKTRYPRDIHIWRPQDDYRVEIQITKLALNGSISADRFDLPQPAGTELVRLAQEFAGNQP
jgi:outer membrane lipoprotein-sorting protein